MLKVIRYIVNWCMVRLLHADCKIHPRAQVSRKASIGKQCFIAKGVSISANVVLGNRVKIGKGIILHQTRINDGTEISSGVVFTGTYKGQTNIGKHVYIGVNNVIDTSSDVSIGDYVHIAGPSTALWCHSSAPMCLASVALGDGTEEIRPTAPIVIESNTYIGCNSTIYPGVTVGAKAIIAPNSAVTKSVKSNMMVGGVPAKEIKK